METSHLQQADPKTPQNQVQNCPELKIESLNCHLFSKSSQELKLKIESFREDLSVSTTF